MARAHLPDPQGLVLLSADALRAIVRDVMSEVLAEQAEGRPVDRDVVGPCEMARRLDISRTTLHRMRIDGCPAVRLGDVYKYEPAAVLRWLKSRGQQ